MDVVEGDLQDCDTGIVTFGPYNNRGLGEQQNTGEKCHRPIQQ